MSAIFFSDGYRELIKSPDRRWWQFWKASHVFGELKPYKANPSHKWDELK